MLEEFVGRKIVIDLRSPYVCLGTLHRFDDRYLEIHGADLHDLRDTGTGRENYIAESKRTGIKRNRKRLLLVREEVISISSLEDVLED